MSTAPFVAHSNTSAAAAAEIESKLNTLQAQVLRTLRQHGPQTDERLCELTSMNPSTLRPRRVELVAKGLVVADGEGRTKANRRATLWRAVAEVKQLSLFTSRGTP